MADPVTRPRSRGPQGAPPDGPGTIDLVPADRSQSSEIRAQHLSGDGGGFRYGDPARILLAGARVAPGAASGSVVEHALVLLGWRVHVVAAQDEDMERASGIAVSGRRVVEEIAAARRRNGVRPR